jgi:hypothetical protein
MERGQPVGRWLLRRILSSGEEITINPNLDKMGKIFDRIIAIDHRLDKIRFTRIPD